MSSRATCLWFCFIITFCFPVAADEEKEQLTNASFSMQPCSRSISWQFDSYGRVRSGYMNVGELRVNASRFRAGSPKMVKKTGEYVLEQTMNDLRVTRRILFDKEKSCARYLEIFHNPGNSDKNVSVALQVEFNMSGPPMKRFTTSGSGFAATLGKKDAGFVTGYQTNQQMHFGGPQQMSQMGDLLWILTGRRNKHKPTINQSGSANQRVEFSITVKGGETMSLVHYVAQRKNLSQSNVKDAMKDFIRYGRLIKHKVPDPLRKTVFNFNLGSNFSGGRLAGHAMQGVSRLVEELGIERGPFDVLMLGEEAMLSGTASCTGLNLDSAFGRLSIDFDGVAAVTGTSAAGHPIRLYMRNGEILAGLAVSGTITMVTRSDMEFQIPLERISVLVARAGEDDGKVPEDASAYLSTCSGDRLLMKSGDGIPFKLLCPWGGLDVKLGKHDQLLFSSEMRPAYRLLLQNGTNLSVMPNSPELSFDTCRFGGITFQSRNLLGLVWVKEEAGPGKEAPTEQKDTGDGREDGKPGKPLLTLTGNNLIAGSPGLPEIHLKTTFGMTTVKLSDLAGFKRSEDSPESGIPVFDIQLKNGTTFSGVLRERLIPVACGESNLKIPVQHLVSYVAPEAGEAPVKAPVTPPVDTASVSEIKALFKGMSPEELDKMPPEVQQALLKRMEALAKAQAADKAEAEKSAAQKNREAKVRAAQQKKDAAERAMLKKMQELDKAKESKKKTPAKPAAK